METHTGDDFSLSLVRDREVLLEQFEIADDVVIPPGDYEFDSIGIEVGGAEERAIAPELELDAIGVFSGLRSTESQLSVKYTQTFRL